MWQNDGENCGEMRLLDGFKVDVDTIDMEVNKGLLAFGAEGVTNPDAKSLKIRQNW